jgi:hypothetical protein
MLMKLRAKIDTRKSREIIDNYIESERPHFMDENGLILRHETKYTLSGDSGS